MIERLRRFADRGNAVRFLLSFLLAFALWAWVTNDRDPDVPYRASQVPVEVVNLHEGLEVVGELPAVNITLHGPRSVIRTIDAGAIAATVDLDDISTPGRHELKVEVVAPEGIRKVDSEPEIVVVELGNVVARTIAVSPITPEEGAPNLRVTGATVTPSEVTIIGVQQNLDRVASVVVPIDVAGRTESFAFEATPIAVDLNNEEVDGISIDPERVRVDVTLVVRGKVVPVFVDCECNAAEGFEVVGQPVAAPDTVLVDGPPDVLEQIPYIFTTQVSTNDMTATGVVEDVPLDIASLPDGVTVEPAFVDVSVRVDRAIFSETIENVPVQVLNAPAGARVSVSPAAVAVTVLGQREAVSAMTDSDISVVVDVDGRGPGTYQLLPRVLLPPDMRYSEPLEAIVVTIVEVAPTSQPTPAPSPTPRPEPTATP
jgi:YbbR domain-containing protein